MATGGSRLSSAVYWPIGSRSSSKETCERVYPLHHSRNLLRSQPVPSFVAQHRGAAQLDSLRFFFAPGFSAYLVGRCLRRQERSKRALRSQYLPVEEPWVASNRPQ